MSVLTSCPDDASFAALIEGGLSGDPRHAIIDHAAECHDCRELLSALTGRRKQEAEVEQEERVLMSSM